MATRLDGLIQRYALQSAQQLSQQSIREQSQKQLQAMKNGGLLDRNNNFTQPLDKGGAAYLQKLRSASATGRLPQMPRNGMSALGNIGNMNFGNFLSSSSAGGVNGMDGGGGFAGPITNSLPQGGTPTASVGGGGLQSLIMGNSRPSRGGGNSAPPPVSFNPGRPAGRPTGLPRRR